MSRAEVITMAGVGHLDGLFDAADQINAGLLAFLAQHRGVDGGWPRLRAG